MKTAIGGEWKVYTGPSRGFFFLKIRIQNNFCGMQLTENTSESPMHSSTVMHAFIVRDAHDTKSVRFMIRHQEEER
jgi:hypothetical protein